MIDNNSLMIRIMFDNIKFICFQRFDFSRRPASTANTIANYNVPSHLSVKESITPYHQYKKDYYMKKKLDFIDSINSIDGNDYRLAKKKYKHDLNFMKHNLLKMKNKISENEYKNESPIDNEIGLVRTLEDKIVS